MLGGIIAILVVIMFFMLAGILSMRSDKEGMKIKINNLKAEARSSYDKNLDLVKDIRRTHRHEKDELRSDHYDVCQDKAHEHSKKIKNILFTADENARASMHNEHRQSIAQWTTRLEESHALIELMTTVNNKLKEQLVKEQTIRINKEYEILQPLPEPFLLGE